jgi:hypothetical protein
MSFLAIGYIIVIIEMFKLALYVGITVIGMGVAAAVVVRWRAKGEI